MRRAAWLTCACLLLLFLFLIPGAGQNARRAATPDRIDDAAFWQLSADLSEPGGIFRSDNLVSNERTFPLVLPEIARRASPASAYVGVGPEQNFSYLAALRPRIAFIVDIRRQNAVLHLFYKALFELSPTRAEFLSRLFARPRARHLGTGSTARELMEAFAVGTPSLDLLDATLLDVRTLLTRTHGWPVDDSDLAGMTQVAEAFFEAGPDIRYSMRPFRRGRAFPTYAELMTAVDQAGVGRSYLATEESYQALRAMQQRNLVVPVVGDFAGAKALKAVGAYLERRGLVVTTFYTSNVEFYLFRNDDWRRFYENLAALPSNRRSVLVRSLFRGMGGYSGFGSRGGTPGGGGFGMLYPGGSLEGRLALDPISDLLAAVRRGNIAGYGDIFARALQEAR